MFESSVKTPWPLELIPRDLIPPSNTVISGAVKFNNWALSSIISSGETLMPDLWKFLKPSECGSKTSKDAASVWSSVASPLPGVNGTLEPVAISIPILPANTITSATEAPVSFEIVS